MCKSLSLACLISILFCFKNSSRFLISTTRLSTEALNLLMLGYPVYLQFSDVFADSLFDTVDSSDSQSPEPLVCLEEDFSRVVVVLLCNDILTLRREDTVQVVRVFVF